jgi:MinD-like ATPase involved in chromosome partitioning or flagellar assembly
MSKFKGLKDLVQTAIDKGASSVEEVHNKIANMPLNVLEKITPLETPAKEIKQIHEKTVGTVYDIIRTVNNEVGEIADALLSHVESNKKNKEENE